MLFTVRMTVRLPAELPPEVRADALACDRAFCQSSRGPEVARPVEEIAGEFAALSVFDMSGNDELHDVLWNLPSLPDIHGHAAGDPLVGTGPGQLILMLDVQVARGRPLRMNLGVEWVTHVLLSPAWVDDGKPVSTTHLAKSKADAHAPSMTGVARHAHGRD